MWIENYNNREKLFLGNEGIVDNSVSWKPRKTDDKHAARSILMYKLDLKAANVGHTHTHTHTKWVL